MARRGMAWWVGACCLAAGCAVDPDPVPEREASAPNAELGRFARVHVRLWPNADPLEPEAPLRTQARFVEHVGMSPAEARARTDLGPLPIESLELGACRASDVDPGVPVSDEDDGTRALELLDVGDVLIRSGSAERAVSLALVPDLLTWMHGVEYNDHDDLLPTMRRPARSTPLHVVLEGSDEVDLPPTDLELEVPTYLRLVPSPNEDANDDALRVQWVPPGDSEGSVLLRLQAFEADAPVGEEVLCLVADSGVAELDFADLAAEGLAPDTESLRISASRFFVRSYEVGPFAPLEAVVEVVDQAYLSAASGEPSHEG